MVCPDKSQLQTGYEELLENPWLGSVTSIPKPGDESQEFGVLWLYSSNNQLSGTEQFKSCQNEKKTFTTQKKQLFQLISKFSYCKVFLGIWKPRKVDGKLHRGTVDGASILYNERCLTKESRLSFRFKTYVTEKMLENVMRIHENLEEEQLQG